MSVFDIHFEALRSRFEAANQRLLQSGAVLISIPGFDLPDGWTKQKVELRFIAPSGYPFSKPDCFWVDPDLRLSSSGQMPQNTNHSPIPEFGNDQYLWFSWHTATWNPNRDSLLTYVNVIRNRFVDLR